MTEIVMPVNSGCEAHTLLTAAGESRHLNRLIVRVENITPTCTREAFAAAVDSAILLGKREVRSVAATIAGSATGGENTASLVSPNGSKGASTMDGGNAKGQAHRRRRKGGASADTKHGMQHSRDTEAEAEGEEAVAVSPGFSVRYPDPLMWMTFPIGRAEVVISQSVGSSITNPEADEARRKGEWELVTAMFVGLNRTVLEGSRLRCYVVQEHPTKTQRELLKSHAATGGPSLASSSHGRAPATTSVAHNLAIGFGDGIAADAQRRGAVPTAGRGSANHGRPQLNDDYDRMRRPSLRERSLVGSDPRDRFVSSNRHHSEEERRRGEGGRDGRWRSDERDRNRDDYRHPSRRFRSPSPRRSRSPRRGRSYSPSGSSTPSSSNRRRRHASSSQYSSYSGSDWSTSRSHSPSSSSFVSDAVDSQRGALEESRGLTTTRRREPTSLASSKDSLRSSRSPDSIT